MKILTVNWHEGYIHLLAKTGYQFDVVQKWKGGRFGWIKEFRPVPPNCHLISEDEARKRLNAGRYDRIIAHNINDLISVDEWPIPKVLIFHNKFTCENALGGNKVDRTDYLAKCRQVIDMTENLTLVFISETKKEDWGFDGVVILPGIDPSEYGGYTGSEEKVLRIGNGLAERDIMLGYSVQERVVKGLSSTILGLNPSISYAIMPKDWEELKEFMRSHRVYLNTTMHPYEDGYNLAMLEAMATGMPVVSIANPTSPIEDGINGFLSGDENYLRERIKELLNDQSLARSIGQKGRETVIDKFPIERFINEWKRVLRDHAHPVRPTKSGKQAKRLKILMSYTSNPVTTAAYIEKALRKDHDVITYGPAISDEILKMWDLEKIKERIKDHDISYAASDDRNALKKLPSGWTPDLFLWIETGIWYELEGVESMPCPSACYLVDTHLNLERHIDIAKRFDVVFVAQKEYLPNFKENGIQNVFWLPLACDPEIHGKKGDDKLYDIGFVGSLNNPQRIELLNKLRQGFNIYYERCFLERMAEVFSQSKIVFNNSVRSDLNMRVFEAMCSGSMLLTDEAEGSGLTELFQDRKHLVIYRNEKELLELADYYLKNDAEREKVAASGVKEVLAKHTYEHRVKEMVEQIASCPSKKVVHNPEEKNEIQNRKISSIDTNNSDYFRQERREVEALIPNNAMRVLDVGCGEGVLGKRLSEKGVKEVVGIEINPDAAKKAERNISRVLCGDVEAIELPFERGYFDCIIFADILEHLKDPITILKRFRDYLSDSGVIVASIPNVGHYGIINMLVEGHWSYQDYGILDRTHLRFFTKKEIEALLNNSGFEITGISENMDPAYNSITNPLSGEISFGRVTIGDLRPDELRGLFVIQYLIRAQKAAVTLIDAGSRDIEDSKKALEGHLELHPLDMDILYRHAEVCYKLGLLDKAIEGLENILIFEPERKEALELREAIHNADDKRR